MLFIPRGNWKALYFIKVYRLSEVLYNRYVLAFFETSDFKGVRILFFISAILIPRLKYNGKTKIPK